MRFATRIHGRLRHLMWRLARLAAARRETRMLLRADERVLKEVGLTRGDVQAVTYCRAMARAATLRRNEAMTPTWHSAARSLGAQRTRTTFNVIEREWRGRP